MKKHKYIAARCHCKNCGNYCKLYKNNCRALNGLVPGNHFDCYAFTTKAAAYQLDKKIEAETEKRKNVKK